MSLWESLCATIRQEADGAATLTTLERKRSGFEVKTPYLASLGARGCEGAGTQTNIWPSRVLKASCWKWRS